MNVLNSRVFSITTLILGFFYCQLAWSANNAFEFSLQRMTYNEGSKSISIGLRNNEKKAYLVQASMRWLDESTGLQLIDKKENPPFILTPLLQKIEPEEYYEWVIKFTGSESALPTDRESVYISQFRLIPSTSEETPNVQMNFIRALNFKVYYRPKSLEGIKIKDAEKKLSLSIDGNKIIAKNDSPIYLAFNTIKINGKEIELQELSKNVPPFGTQEYLFFNKKNVTSIHWQVLDEFMFPLDEKMKTVN
ncbi:MULTISPECIES: molecular chaperone [Proteus]|uniref:fimbrial biogenesis chaperone n=1 Tax=Proteus TaxID=583 RepID=UPI0013A594DC|nr:MULTISPECIES: molecular chaperone [Proteus]MBJ2110385.1 molecular chaperone [Proteus terrae]MBJ2134314.1 molecular chaperone [Proteus terrae]MCW9687903.1 molecular chaperone [Proteus terrae]MDR9740670.1 molecular chaperone [Proteus terrae]